MNEPAHDVAPEEQAIAQRLDALPASWVTPELRDAAARQARAAAFAREAHKHCLTPTKPYRSPHRRAT